MCIYIYIYTYNEVFVYLFAFCAVVCLLSEDIISYHISYHIISYHMILCYAAGVRSVPSWEPQPNPRNLACLKMFVDVDVGFTVRRARTSEARGESRFIKGGCSGNRV